MAASGTNDSNALSWLSPDQLSSSMRAKLMAMALNGDSIVNPLGAAFDYDGRTPQGRARKEREQREEWAYRQAMADIEERRAEFQKTLDRLDQASFEALQDNEERLRAAKEELRRIQERAYEITLPDGTVARVYRDGDKVRTESGAEVGRDVLRAEDMPDAAPSWSDFFGTNRRIEDLTSQNKDIQEYRKRLHEARQRADANELSAADIEKTERQLEDTMPPSVRESARAATSLSAETLAADEVQPQAKKMLVRPFATAVSDDQPIAKLSEQDFDLLQQTPAASKPAPK